MATKSGHQEPEKAGVIEEMLDALETSVDRVKVLYEQYFLGIQKQPPTYIHTDLERKVRDLSQLQIRNTALRYRFVTVQQKIGSYNSYWRRTLRQIESGTYVRNLSKISRQSARSGAEVPEEILAAMPKRMRDQVKRDREAALALARLREKPSSDAADLLTLAEPVVELDVDLGDLDAAAFVGESADLRRDVIAAADGAQRIDEADADFDVDAFFAAVTSEALPRATPKLAPSPPAAPPRAAPAAALPKPAPSSPAPIPPSGPASWRGAVIRTPVATVDAARLDKPAAPAQRGFGFGLPDDELDWSEPDAPPIALANPLVAPSPAARPPRPAAPPMAESAPPAAPSPPAPEPARRPIAPSQAARPLPIIPGAAAAHTTAVVETLSGPFPRIPTPPPAINGQRPPPPLAAAGDPFPGGAARPLAPPARPTQAQPPPPPPPRPPPPGGERVPPPPPPTRAPVAGGPVPPRAAGPAIGAPVPPPAASASLPPRAGGGPLPPPAGGGPVPPRAATPAVGAPALPRTPTPAAGVPVPPRAATPAVGAPALPRTPTPAAGEPVPPRAATPAAGAPGLPRTPTPAAGVPALPRAPTPASGVPAPPRAATAAAGAPGLPRTPTPAAGVPVPPRAAPPAVGAAVPPRAPVPHERRELEPRAAPAHGMSDADVNALYAKYVRAKQILGEDAGPGAYNKLLTTINTQAPKIMEQYKSKGVDFSVVVQDNQVIIRAKPKP